MKLRFWSKIEILVKIEVLVKIEILIKIRNFGQKSTFRLKIKILVKNHKFKNLIFV